jgi:hypothetical protein
MSIAIEPLSGSQSPALTLARGVRNGVWSNIKIQKPGERDGWRCRDSCPLLILAFDYLEGFSSLEEFLEDFPTVSRERAVAVLEAAHERLAANASAA